MSIKPLLSQTFSNEPSKGLSDDLNPAPHIGPTPSPKYSIANEQVFMPKPFYAPEKGPNYTPQGSKDDVKALSERASLISPSRKRERVGSKFGSSSTMEQPSPFKKQKRTESCKAEKVTLNVQNPLSSFPISHSNPGNPNEIHYVLCNETGQSECLQAISRQPLVQGGVHLGFSSWFNLDVMAERKSEIGIICNIDDNALSILNLMKEVTLTAESPSDFTEKFWAALEQLPDQVFDGFLLSENESHDFGSFQEKYLQKGWLSSQEKFMHIKSMYQENRIIHRKLDILDQDNTFSKIHSWLNSNGLQLDTFYDSTIREWIRYESYGSEKQMHSNTAEIISSNTLVLTANREFASKGSPTLSMHTGTHPQLTYGRTDGFKRSQRVFNGGTIKQNHLRKNLFL